MTEKISEADIIYITDFRAARRAPLPQRTPLPPSPDFSLLEPRPRLKLIHGIDILSKSVMITIDEGNPIFDALHHKMYSIDLAILDY